MKKYIVAASVVLAIVACTGSDSVTGPGVPNTGVSQQGGQVGNSDTTVATVAPTGQAGAKVWEHGVVDVTGPWTGYVCYFWNGPHEQDKAHPDIPVSVAAGETTTIHWPGIKADSDPNHCEVQIDVGTSCARSSIIPGMLAHGYKKVKDCDECVPGDWVETGRDRDNGEWSECHKHPDVNLCFREREWAETIVESNGCETRTAIADGEDSEQCVCSNECEPGEWEVVSVEKTGEEWGDCERQPVASTVRPAGCIKRGTETYLITEFDGCTERTRTETRDVREACDCPVEGVCYYTPDCRDHGGFSMSTRSCPDEAKQLLCENEGGVWANWNGQNNQCKTDLPGIYKDNFRLVPGQSHPDCLKFTGHD